MKLLVGSVSGKVLLLHEDEAQWPEDPNPILLSRVRALRFYWNNKRNMTSGKTNKNHYSVALLLMMLLCRPQHPH